MHNDEKTDDNIASGSKIREMILNGEDFYRFIPEIEGDIFKNTATLQNGERVLLHILRNMKREEYLSLADINEGLEQRILNSAKVSKKLDEFFENVKAKRYTLSRIRRIILNAVLQIHDYENSPYIRVLGFSENALPLLKEMKRAAKLPIVSSFADAKKQGKRAEEYFLKEASYTDFYTMLGREIRVSGLEFQKSVVKI